MSMNGMIERAMEAERRKCLAENDGELWLRAIDCHGVMVGRKYKRDNEAEAREMAKNYWTKPTFIYVEVFGVFEEGKLCVIYHGFRSGGR